MWIIKLLKASFRALTMKAVNSIEDEHPGQYEPEIVDRAINKTISTATLSSSIAGAAESNLKLRAILMYTVVNHPGTFYNQETGTHEIKIRSLNFEHFKTENKNSKLIIRPSLDDDAIELIVKER